MHLAAENFADAAGIDISHVPYKGEAPAFTDLIGGQMQFMVGNIAAASALLGTGPPARAGRHRQAALAAAARRAHGRPRAGLPGFENFGWFGLLAPAGTPAEVIAKVQRDTAKALADTETKARLYVQRHGAGGQHAGRVRQADGRRAGALGQGGEEPQAGSAMRCSIKPKKDAR